MQIIKYEISKNSLTVGFKEDNFVVYSQIPYDSTKTKQELLQMAYVQAKPAIDYEKTLSDHAITTDEIGEEFIPETPRVSRVEIIREGIQNYFSCLEEGDLAQQYTAKVYDQYGDEMSSPVAFSLNATPAGVTLDKGLLTVGQSDADYDLVLTATSNGISDTLPVYVRKCVAPVIDPTPTLEDRVSAVEDALLMLI